MDNTKRDILALVSLHAELQATIDEVLNTDLSKFGLFLGRLEYVNEDSGKLVKNIRDNIEENIIALMAFYATYEEIEEDQEEPFLSQEFYAAAEDQEENQEED